MRARSPSSPASRVRPRRLALSKISRAGALSRLRFARARVRCTYDLIGRQHPKLHRVYAAQLRGRVREPIVNAHFVRKCARKISCFGAIVREDDTFRARCARSGRARARRRGGRKCCVARSPKTRVGKREASRSDDLSAGTLQGLEERNYRRGARERERRRLES